MERSDHLISRASADVRASDRSASGEVFLELANLTKTYGNLTVIKNVSLKINRGEFISLLGPSGCGKTTALRMVAGLEEVSDGTLSIGGTVVNDIAL